MFGNGFWCKEDTLAERMEDEKHRLKIENERIAKEKKERPKEFVMIKGYKNECITNFATIRKR